MLFYVIALLVAAIDQITKYAIRSALQVGETMPFYKELITLTHYQNTGAAGSSLPGSARYLGILAVIFVGAIIYYRKKGNIRGVLVESGAALLVGGAVGNGIDRLLYGQVTDFLIFRSGSGVMNLADLAINAGCVLVVVYMVLSMRKKRSAYNE